MAYGEFATSEQAMKPMGCGPFIFEEYVVGDYVKFVANENFWNGRPYMDELILKIGADAGSEGEINFETGQIDCIGMNKSYYREMEDRTDEFTFVINDTATTNFGIDFMPYMQRDLVWDYWTCVSSRTFRAALAYMIDYDMVVNSLFYGYAQRVHSIFTAGMQAYEPVTNYTYDPEKAKTMLDEAGFIDTDGNGIRNYTVEAGGHGEDCILQLWYVSAGSENEYMSIVLADAFAECGIAAIPYLINTGTFMEEYLDQWNKENDEIGQAIDQANLEMAQILFPMANSYGIWPTEWKYAINPELAIGAYWKEYTAEEDYNRILTELGYDGVYDFNGDNATEGYIMMQYGAEQGPTVIELVELNRQVLAETDPAKQQELYKQIQDVYCNDLLAYLPIAGTWDMMAYQKRVHLEECDYDLRISRYPMDMEHMWLS